jgi:nucleoside 2-deoxyribosyltransferase
MTVTPPGAPGAALPVYIAGPMFSVADLGEQLNIATALEAAGYTTYLPQRDGIEVAAVMGDVNANLNLPASEVESIFTFVRKIVFAMDIYQLINRCGAVVFNMDGRVPDDGSVSETASGFIAGKPVVILKTTPVSMLGGYDNPMVSGLSVTWSYVTQIADLPAALSKRMAAVAALGGPPFQAGPELARVEKLGAAVWGLMPTIRNAATLPPGQLAGAVQALQQQLKGLIDDAFPDQ